MAFRVGQKVACTRKDSWTLVSGDPDKVDITLPKYGDILTIRETWVSSQSGKLNLRFIEHDCSASAKWFWSRYFKPLISQADDVEMFRRISEDSLGRLEAYEELLNESFCCDETHE